MLKMAFSSVTAGTGSFAIQEVSSPHDFQENYVVPG
jgi:hypothetical protein